jgi:hypothetical protein
MLWGHGYRTILVDVHNVFGTTDRRSVTARCVVVSAVELVQNKSRAITAEVLDFHQLISRHEVACGITRVGGQQHLGTTGDFLGDLVGMDAVVVIL